VPRPRVSVPVFAGLVAVFAFAALLNAGGYRFGASDQAFYIPAVAHHADPSLFPRDWRMLGAQDGLNAFTSLAGWAVRGLGIPLPSLFLALFLVTLLALGAGALALGLQLSRARATAAAILFALTLKHAVALGAVNTLEGYAHPRMLAFALGVLALAALLDGRTWIVAALVALAGVVHPTTAIWFAIVVGVALFVAQPRWRPWLAAAAAVLAIISAWAVLAGPLAPRLTRMDADWLAALEGKRYLFTDRWPGSEWLVLGAYVAVIAAVFRHRWRRGLTSPAESGVLAGLAGLLALFALALPLNAARVAFVIQLQVPRVLWLLDLVAVAYLVWFLAEGGKPSEGRTRARNVAVAILALALARGAYVTFVEHPERALLQVQLPPSDWNRALWWIEAHTPPDALVAAHPGHAWRFGTSVRVGAKRDVLLEEVKDSAMALYGRESALRDLDRIRALERFDSLTDEGARELATRYGASVLVIDRDLELPLLHRQGPFRIYALPGPGLQADPVSMP
jgi:hypothetical protein